MAYGKGYSGGSYRNIGNTLYNFYRRGGRVLPGKNFLDKAAMMGKNRRSRVSAAQNKYMKNRRKIMAKAKVVKGVRGKIGYRFPAGSRRMKNKDGAYATYGIDGTYEYNGTTTTINQCIYIGHGTAPAQTIGQNICLALVKRLLMKADLMPVAGNVYAILDNMNGYEMGAYYIDSVDSAGSVQYNGFGPITLVTQLNDLGNALYSLWTPSNLGATQRQIRHLVLFDGSTPSKPVARISVMNSVVKVKIESRLKIQNRTQAVGADGNQTTTITSNPLIGKTYSGSGNGSDFIDNSTTLTPFNFYINNANGVIDRAPGLSSLQEPPMGKMFPQVKKVGGYSIKPGEVKTSYLRSYNVAYINRFMEYLVAAGSGTPRPSGLKYGKFRFIALEKLIDPVETEPDITVGFEHNLHYSIMVIPREENVTTQKYESSYKP